MAIGRKTLLTNDRAGKADFLREVSFFFDAVGGSAVDEDRITNLNFDGELVDLQVTFDTPGTGGTDIKVDVLDDGVSVLSTLAAYTPSAAAESVVKVGSAVANTTAPVIDSSKKNIAKNSKVKINMNVTGNYSPDSLNVEVRLVFYERQDFDPVAPA